MAAGQTHSLTPLTWTIIMYMWWWHLIPIKNLAQLRFVLIELFISMDNYSIQLLMYFLIEDSIFYSQNFMFHILNCSEWNYDVTGCLIGIQKLDCCWFWYLTLMIQNVHIIVSMHTCFHEFHFVPFFLQSFLAPSLWYTVSEICFELLTFIWVCAPPLCHVPSRF